MTRSARGKQARDRGRRAEFWAMLWLRLKGYRILAHGWSPGRGTGGGEIDIIARTGRTIAFIEVKSRFDQDAAAWAIQPYQQRRIVRSAEAFLARHSQWGGHQIRFDAILMSRHRWPCHILNAWHVES